ncbi:hypothetical protein [Streptomyces sp. NPDC051569]|uniref:hypothetical protein n=1 Tax=Streptomyces sp. NPDC051569 TaxID=3365661 RepID=UPI0037A39B1E
MSLVKLIAQADERGLAASGLACLDRCLPLLAEETDALRPLWAGIVRAGTDWPERLTAARDTLDSAAGAEAARDVAAALVRVMLDAAPSEWAAEPLRAWSDTCSAVALEIHQQLDAVGEGARGSVTASERLARYREDAEGVADAVVGTDGADGVGPLVAGELRRQIRILEVLAATPGAPGLRRVMDLSTEGQRVLRAVVSRRARARS